MVWYPRLPLLCLICTSQFFTGLRLASIICIVHQNAETHWFSNSNTECEWTDKAYRVFVQFSCSKDRSPSICLPIKQVSRSTVIFIWAVRGIMGIPWSSHFIVMQPVCCIWTANCLPIQLTFLVNYSLHAQQCGRFGLQSGSTLTVVTRSEANQQKKLLVLDQDYRVKEEIPLDFGPRHFVVKDRPDPCNFSAERDRCLPTVIHIWMLNLWAWKLHLATAYSHATWTRVQIWSYQVVSILC